MKYTVHASWIVAITTPKTSGLHPRGIGCSGIGGGRSDSGAGSAGSAGRGGMGSGVGSVDIAAIWRGIAGQSHYWRSNFAPGLQPLSRKQ